MLDPTLFTKLSLVAKLARGDPQPFGENNSPLAADRQLKPI